jgi:hypothetical protein
MSPETRYGRQLIGASAGALPGASASSKTTSTGVSIDVYAPAGELTYGSVGPEYESDERQPSAERSA